MNSPVPTFPTDQTERLAAAIAVHDDIDMAAMLPARITLAYESALLERCYWLSYRLWEQADRNRFVALSRRIARTGQLDGSDSRVFKDIRARAKQLRFAFGVLGEGQRYPFLLDHLTRVMGHAQDAIRTRRKRAGALRGIVLHTMSNRVVMSALDRQLRSFLPSGPAAFGDYIREEIGRIEKVLAMPAVTNAEFHDTRKIISRLVALYDTLTVLAPSGYHRAVTRYLSTINGLMGGMHDEMIARKADNPRDYRRVAEPLTPAVAERLAALVAAFTADGQSRPGASTSALADGNPMSE